MFANMIVLALCGLLTTLPVAATPEPTAPVAITPEPVVIYPMPAALEQEIIGNSWREDSPAALESLALVTVRYYDFSGEIKTGELIVHHQLAGELLEIFEELYEAGFPLESVARIELYGCDDDASMAANNSYAFCTRAIAGTKRFSMHSYGMAVDLNPVQNPYMLAGTVQPEAAATYLDRGDVRPGMIISGDACHTAFTSRGWTWGGDWPSPDYQHFEKWPED